MMMTLRRIVKDIVGLSETMDMIYPVVFVMFMLVSFFFYGGLFLLPIIMTDADAALQVMERLYLLVSFMLLDGASAYYFFFSYTDLGDSLSIFVMDTTRKAIDDMMFFPFLMCTTNLGDSLITYNNNCLNLRRPRKFGAHSRHRRIVVDYGCWHDLRVELMEMILQRTDVTDRVRMSLVCKSWESLLKRKDVRVPPQFPWLSLPTESRFCKNLTFYDMSHGGRIHDLKLPKGIRRGRFLGSSKGWLIMVTREPLLQRDQIFIFNPISGAHHKLPSLRTLPRFRYNPIYHIQDPCPVENLFGRIELSSEDPSNCIAATIICDTENKLAFCRIGGESWDIYEDSIEDELVDILFSTSEKILYVLKYTYSNQESVATYSFTSTDYQVTLKIFSISPSNPTLFPAEEYDDAYFEHYIESFSSVTTDIVSSHLVESTSGQLLLIQKIMDSFETMVVYVGNADAIEEVAGADEDDDAIEDNNEEDDAIEDDDNEEDGAIVDDIDEGNEVDNEVVEQVEDNVNTILKYCRTRRFNVYMLDPETGVEGVTRLKSLGNQILLFSSSGLSFVQGRDFTGFQGNCIYFIEDDINNGTIGENSPLVSRESGIFYLDDERIERSFPSVKLPVWSRMGWFTPNPLNQFNL